MNKIRVGFLPLYLKLYDETCRFMRPRIEEFNRLIQRKLADMGLEVVAAPICRIKEEFEKAVELFDDVSAVITLHLAYSPSLESISSLKNIDVPIIVLDTTPTYKFDNLTDTEEILYNHGIHGVQDMCNMLKRENKLYFIEAGHINKSDVLERVYKLCKIASAAKEMKNARVGLIGESFVGMGDFYISPDYLKSTIGAEVIKFDMNSVKNRLLSISSKDIEAEMKDDLDKFTTGDYNKEAHYRTAKADLLVRNWIEENNLTAYTLNFANITKESCFECVPFIEACKAMSRNIGFAGEGDILTAVLCRAMLSIYNDTTFTEMFCPDWENNTIFMSHMGEMNIHTAKGKMKLTEKDYPYSDVDNPMAVYGCLKPGKGVIVNIAPMNGNFEFILAPVSVMDIDGEDKMADSIHGWIKPDIPIADFLKKYSMAGGTHHLVLVYGEVIEELMIFGRMMNFNVEVISLYTA